jgi:hypothetical protein
MPADNRLRVPEPEETLPPVTNNLPVVFDPRNALVDERMMPPDVAGPPRPQQARPNWVYGQNDFGGLPPDPRFSPPPPAGPQLTYDLSNRSAEQRRAYETAVMVDSELKSMSEKEVTNRLLDAKWNEQAIKKAREKAAGFDEIARRAKDRDAVMLANANRERMLNFAEELEDRLRSIPKVKYGQGPKTRAAKTLPPVIVKATRLPPEE